METYAPYSSTTHTIRVTFQCEGYVGHIAHLLGGNCRGIEVMRTPFELITQTQIDRFPLNDCNLRYHEDGRYYSALLTAPDGSTLVISGDAQEMGGYIVATEIIAYEEDRETIEYFANPLNSVTDSKHISEVRKGDVLLINGRTVTAASDAYNTKTHNGREWNFETSDDEYVYASDLEAGIVLVLSNS